MERIEIELKMMKFLIFINVDDYFLKKNLENIFLEKSKYLIWIFAPKIVLE